MVYVIQVCWQLASRIRTELSFVLILLASYMTYTIAVCTVQNSWWWAEELSRNTQSFIPKIKLQLCQTAVPSWCCSQAVWHIPLLCVQWKTPDDGQRNCPKHVEFYSKNKFEKLVHLVGFIIRSYHDAGHLNVKRENWSFVEIWLV